MKKILWVSVIVAVLLACNKNQDNVVPVNDQNVLGLVLQTSTQSSSNNLILLKDGRAINPVSGFNPANLQAGDKFKLSFIPTAGATSSSKIIKVHVTNYTAANDSAFVPPPTIGIDTISTESFIQGTFNGTFTVTTLNYSNPIDTTNVTQDVCVTFIGSTYIVTLLANNQSGGSGTFNFDANFDARNNDLINFVDPKIYPVGYEVNLLNGQYNCQMMKVDDSDFMYFSNTTTSTSTRYMLKRQ